MKTLIVLLGPTGVGKTETAIALAEWLDCPIVNADSRQVFRELRIGTAAPTTEEQARAKHYFVGTKSIADYYSAALYEEEATTLITKLFETQDVVLLSGGSMMYVDAVCHGIDDLPTILPEVRETMKRRLDAEGLPALYEELTRLDPTYAAECDPKNTRRVVHALEICHQTGGTFSALRRRERKPRPWRTVKIGLRREREELFSRINARVDAMMSAGLMAEVQAFTPEQRRELNALNTVGYKELSCVLNGEWELPMAVERIKKNTRVYAKKQLTWWAKDETIHWFHPLNMEAIKALIRERV